MAAPPPLCNHTRGIRFSLTHILQGWRLHLGSLF